MKGDIIKDAITLISKKEVGQTFRYTYLSNTGAKAAYTYWLCCLFCKAGYIVRIKNGIFKVVKDISGLGSYKELYYIAYNKDKYGIKVQNSKEF